MTNLEFYKEDIKRNLCDFTFNRAIREALNDDYAIDEYKLLDWLCEEHSILDKEEKEYLSGVIRPFRNKVKHIVKWHHHDSALTDKTFIAILLNTESVSLPYFESNTMYKGMEPNKKYTLKDLGL